jgi:hypothetical protein
MKTFNQVTERYANKIIAIDGAIIFIVGLGLCVIALAFML